MPLKVNAEEFAEKHARRLKGATEDIRRGVERVTDAPGKKAAAKQEKMKAKINEAIDSGRWANNVGKVSVEEWRDKTISKGLGRIASGIDAAHDKVVDFAGQLLPAVEKAKGMVGGMPDLTLEDSIARMSTYAREMAKFKKS